MNIGGTFLDEITHDIPSANWGPEDWAQDFDAMKAIGIDKVILIRGGYRDAATFNSQTLSRERQMRPVYTDLLDLFLTEAERCGMTFFFGTYDSGCYWMNGQPEKELKINEEFTKEVADKYGDRKAFGGWYITQEVSAYSDDVMLLYGELSSHLKMLKDCPVLISPFIEGRKEFAESFSVQEHEKQWEQFFAALSGVIDIVAFQDGHVDFCELLEYLKVNTKLAKKNGIQCWSNVETFERGMPIRFLPIAWENMRYKMELAELAGVEEMITFEFSHFMSPNSPYPSAHKLYERYCEWLSAKSQI